MMTEAQGEVLLKKLEDLRVALERIARVLEARNEKDGIQGREFGAEFSDEFK